MHRDQVTEHRLQLVLQDGTGPRHQLLQEEEDECAE